MPSTATWIEAPSNTRVAQHVSSVCSSIILNQVSIGKTRVPGAPKVVYEYTGAIRNGLSDGVEKKTDQTQQEISEKCEKLKGKGEVLVPLVKYEQPANPYELKIRFNPATPDVSKVDLGEGAKVPLLQLCAGIDATGEVGVWNNTAPPGVSVLFVAKKSNGWKAEQITNPDLSTPYFAAIKKVDANCEFIEKQALDASKALLQFEPKKGFDLSKLDTDTREKVEKLAKGEPLGSMPAVFLNYLTGERVPLELYVSKVTEEPATEASIFVLANTAKKTSSYSYCITDPATGIHAEGKTLKAALGELSKSRYYPPGAIFCQAGSDAFNGSFEKFGVIGASTISDNFAGKIDNVAGALGYFSMGCALAAPETGGLSLAGVIAGLPSMGWFTYRAIEHFVGKVEFEDRAFDPKNLEDWQELGMILVSIPARGKAGVAVRGTGLAAMAGAGTWQFGKDFSELKKSKEDMSEFFLKRGGQLAASLAMSIYFGKKEIAGWKARKTQKTDYSSMSAEDLKAIIDKAPQNEADAAAAILTKRINEARQEREANMPHEVVPKLKEIGSVLSEINGKEYDFNEHPLVKLDGSSPVFAATMDNGRDVILKMVDCREDAFATPLLSKAGIQEHYNVSNHGDFAIIQRVKGGNLESLLETGIAVSVKGQVKVTPEMISSISYEMGKQMAAHYVFSISDWNPRNFIVMFDNGKATVSRIDFEKFSSSSPTDRTLKSRFPENWFDQIQLDKGFLDGMTSIRARQSEIMSYYRQNFQQVVSVQQQRGTPSLRPQEVTLDEVSFRMSRSPEQALQEFKR